MSAALSCYSASGTSVVHGRCPVARILFRQTILFLSDAAVQLNMSRKTFIKFSLIHSVEKSDEQKCICTLLMCMKIRMCKFDHDLVMVEKLSLK